METLPTRTSGKVDRDKLPWPVAADGGGPSLQRLDPGAYADDPANWFADGATPGPGAAPGQGAGAPGLTRRYVDGC